MLKFYVKIFLIIFNIHINFLILIQQTFLKVLFSIFLNFFQNKYFFKKLIFIRKILNLKNCILFQNCKKKNFYSKSNYN